MITVAIIYFTIGLIITIVEFTLNSGDRIELFDFINCIFWFPLLFVDKGKLYKFLNKK